MGAVVFLHECELEDILSDLQQLHRHTKRVQREKTLGKNLWSFIKYKMIKNKNILRSTASIKTEGIKS